MTPADFLDSICLRQRLNREEAEELLPLVRWALEGPESTRAALLDLIERTLAGAPPSEEEGREVLQDAADHALLLQLARRLEERRP
jgi:hypothetical protein